MKIYLLGAEQPTNARLMREGNAKHVGLSFHSLLPRIPKKKEWLVAERIHDAQVYLASGGYNFAKKAGPADCVSFVAKFEDFVENNQYSLSLVTEYDGPLSSLDRTDHRLRMRAMLGDRFAPVWQPEDGFPVLQMLAEQFRIVGLPATEIKGSPGLSARLVPLTARYGVQWHALDGARPDDMATGRFASAATTGWLSPMKFGETIVWDGTRMVRYNAKMKDQARRRHRSTFSRAGFDAAAILEDNHEEISRFTVWSYARMEEAVTTRKPPITSPFTVIEGGGEELSTLPVGNEPEVGSDLALLDVDSSPPAVRNAPAVPTKREDRQLLPTLGFNKVRVTEFNDAGEQVQVERLVATNGTTTMRACDTCFVAATCPAFTPGSECAFDLPVEIKTKDQLNALLSTVLEMQAQRVAFMRFAEEQNGGYADPNLSSEIDRLYDIVEKVKKIQEEQVTFKMQATGAAAGGVLSRILGEKAAKLNELERPMDPARVIHQVIDAD